MKYIILHIPTGTRWYNHNISSKLQRNKCNLFNYFLKRYKKRKGKIIINKLMFELYIGSNSLLTTIEEFDIIEDKE